MIRHTFRLAAIVGAALACIAPGLAQSRIEAGVLECHGSRGASFVIGSVHELNCVFRPSAGPPQNYAGTVRRVGIDLGVAREMRLAWIVLAPTRQIGPTELAGQYGGVSAGAALGVGVGANALIGGSNSSIALQPLSVEGQTGVNLAAGVASFELHPR